MQGAYYMKKRILSLLLAVIGYLGIHNGYLALFDNKDAQPIMVLPYRSELYPEEDHKALQQGIPYTSQEELTQLLEDFLS